MAKLFSLEPRRTAMNTKVRAHDESERFTDVFFSSSVHCVRRTTGSCSVGVLNRPKAIVLLDGLQLCLDTVTAIVGCNFYLVIASQFFTGHNAFVCIVSAWKLHGDDDVLQATKQFSF